MSDIGTETVVVKCPRCDHSRSVNLPAVFAKGAAMRGVHCAHCYEIEDRERAVAVDDATRFERNERWKTLVAPIYRTSGVEGGLTEVSKLQSNPGFADVFAWDGKVNLLLSGPTGAQKTRSAWRVLRREFDMGREVRWFSAFDFQAQCEDAFGEHRRRKFMAEVCAVPVLFFDDLNKARWTESTHGAFFEIVEKRSSNLLPIVATLNDGPSEIRAAMGATKSAVVASTIEPLLRRLRERCHVVLMAPPPPPPPPQSELKIAA